MRRGIREFGSDLARLMVDADRLATGALFRCNSRMRDVIRDESRARFRGLQPVRSWRAILGNVDASIALRTWESTFLIQEAEDRSRNRTRASLACTSEQTSIFSDIVERHHSQIASYLGPNFTMSSVLGWLNFPVDPEIQGYDVYSNVWHVDQHEGSRYLKIFLIPERVLESDGPLEFLEVLDSWKAWRVFRSRHEGMGIPRELPGAKKLTGSAGRYAIVNTALSLHRAGIPETGRSMLQVSLRPSWVSGGVNA